MPSRQSKSLKNQETTPSLWLATLICGLATTFLLYEFILQVSPSIITGELMRDLGLNTTMLGLIGAFYYCAYTAMQLPAGLLFDRFGPRKLLTLATLVCATGALIFGMASGTMVAASARFLMGLGSAFAFTGALVLTSNWFPPRYFAVLTGIVQLSSCIGAIAGQKTLVPFVQTWGWRVTLNNLGIIGLILTVLIWLIVRDAPASKVILSKQATTPDYSLKQELQRLSNVLSNRQTWWVGVYSFMVWAPTTAFHAFWGIPFLKVAYAWSTQEAVNACAILWLSIGIGSPLLGWWSDSIQKRCLPLTLSAILGMITFPILIYIPLSSGLLYFTLFLTGLGATGQALAFGVVQDNNRSEVMGTALAFNNTAVVFGGVLLQPLVGFLLDLGQSTQFDSMREAVYGLGDYQRAFLILPLCYLFAAIISYVYIEETNCRSKSN